MQAACPQELHVRRDDRMNKIKQGASGLPAGASRFVAMDDEQD